MHTNRLSDYTDIVITHNKEDWERLLYLLPGFISPVLLWMNCDTARVRNIMGACLKEALPAYKHIDIRLTEEDTTLYGRIRLMPEPATAGMMIHVWGMEDAVQNSEFRGNINFQRDSLFREIPCHIIIWADEAIATTLYRTAFDFWSWVVFVFTFTTPQELLTARQQGFDGALLLIDETIPIPGKDNSQRIRHLEQEWEDFLGSVNNKPTTPKQMSDAVTISMALSKEFYDEGKYQKAGDILQQALELNPDLINENDKLAIEDGLLSNMYFLGEFEEAKKLGEKVLATRIIKNGEDNPQTATSRSNLAMIYQTLGEYEKAKELLEKALENDIDIFGLNHHRVAIRQSNLATVYQDLGEYEKAKELLGKALENVIKNFGEDHPYVATIQSNLAVVYRDLGNYEKAKELLEIAIENDINNFGENYTTIGNRLSNLGLVYGNLDDYEKAKELLEKALEKDINNFGECHPNVAMVYYNLAWLYYYKEDYKQAQKYMQISYNIRMQVLGYDHPDTIRALDFLKQLEQSK